MNEKKILNNTGFILVETLIVGVFIMGIFSLLYTNFFPIIGEYERYKDYDTVESTYIAHWGRMIALKGLPESVYTTASTDGYVDIGNCSLYSDINMQNYCSAFINTNNISKIYLTSYSTVAFKNFVNDNTSFSRSFREYIAYLPTYSKNTSKTPETGYYRVIVEYVSNNTYKYGNIELFNGESTPEEDDTVSEVVLDPGSDGNIYDDGEDTFITGEDPNNYIWYSGKLWRAVSVNNSAKTTKLVTQWNITAIPYNDESNIVYDGSHMEMWLNDISTDGFLGNLRNYENFIVTDAEWDATEDGAELGSITRPSGTKVTGAVGLLNIYEYQSSYHGGSYETGYLNNGLYWWSLTPYDTTNIRIINDSGAVIDDDQAGSYGVRPSINIKSDIKIVSGEGTEDNPYRLEGDNDSNLTGEKLNTRSSGEYIQFGAGENNLYRIVSHETEGLTKIVSAEPLKVSGQYKKLALGNMNYSATTTMGLFLNGEYLNNYLTEENRNMIEENTTWYIGMIDNGDNYRLGKYTDINMTELVPNRVTVKVGLLRTGELMSGQFESSKTLREGPSSTYWTLTQYNATTMRRVNYLGYGSHGFHSEAYDIRPTLNLKSNVIITGGDGTKNNPFTLSLE